MQADHLRGIGRAWVSFRKEDMVFLGKQKCILKSLIFTPDRPSYLKPQYRDGAKLTQ